MTNANVLKWGFEHKPPRVPLDLSDFYSDFFTKGFYVFSAERLLSQIPIDKFQMVTEKHPDNCFHAEGHEFHSDTQAKYIKAVQGILKEVYIDPLDDCEVAFDFYSDKCNDHVINFHSDAQYAMPGQNATINCFFDDMSKSVGGRFDMVPYNKDLIGTSADVADMASVYPQKYDVVIFNQNRNFLHKANHASVPRRMISFACTFKNINPLHPNWMPG